MKHSDVLNLQDFYRKEGGRKAAAFISRKVGLHLMDSSGKKDDMLWPVIAQKKKKKKKLQQNSLRVRMLLWIKCSAWWFQAEEGHSHISSAL